MLDKIYKISKTFQRLQLSCLFKNYHAVSSYPDSLSSRHHGKTICPNNNSKINGEQLGLKRRCSDKIGKLSQHAVADIGAAFSDLGQGYSKAQGSYVAWRTDVNLDPPASWEKESPPEDKHIHDYYNSLQYMLYETGYPETEDRTSAPRMRHNKEQVVVALLESPVECIATLLEGGRQLPDSFHLVLSPTWVSKVTSEEDSNLYTLLLHKAITFHRDGATYIDVFTEPRRVTYFVNFFTYNATGGQRNDGNEIEKDLDCPMSSSIKLSELVDDKVWTRCIMSEVGMAFPETLALMYKCSKRASTTDSKIRIVHLEETTDLNLIKTEIGAFLRQPFMEGIERIVVKPSGPNYYGSIGVSYHHVTDVTSIETAVESLVVTLEEGESVLVESFVESFNRLPADGDIERLWSADGSLAFRVRSTVCRDFNNVPRTTMINCGISAKDSPINGDNTVCQTLDSTLLTFNVFNENDRRNIEREIRMKSEAVLKCIIAYEKLLVDELQSDTIKGQTDLIGIDLVVTMRDGILTPVGIEVNSHDCTINCQINEFMNRLVQNAVSLHENTDKPQNLSSATQPAGQYLDDGSGSGASELVNTYQGRSVRPWVRNMIVRSQLYLMRGKHVLVIGAGGFSKRHVWPDAENYGIKVTLVDSNAEHFARKLVHNFVHYDFDDHSSDSTHASNIFMTLQDMGVVDLDGCVTFWEDCVPLTALLVEMIGLTGSTYEAALNGKKKSRTQSMLRKRQDDTPHWPRTYLYTSDTQSITSKDDLEYIINRFAYPVMLKLEHGSSSVGVSLVHSHSALKDEYTRISETFKTEADYPGIGLGHDNTMVVMDYQKGSEHDVDVVIYDRKLVAAFISDNGHTRIPLFTETAASMPSSLPVDKQAQLLAAAYQCCTEIGLTDGTFNVELKMTPTGPKLIEINARMGGFYLREWIRRLYGIDILLCSFMIACGIKPYVPKLPPGEQLMGIMLLPSLHKHVLGNENVMKSIRDLDNKDDIIWTQFSETVEESRYGDLYEEPFGNIAVIDSTIDGARNKLLHICKHLGIESDKYNVRQFVKHF